VEVAVANCSHGNNGDVPRVENVGEVRVRSILIHEHKLVQRKLKHPVEVGQDEDSPQKEGQHSLNWLQLQVALEGKSSVRVEPILSTELLEVSIVINAVVEQGLEQEDQSQEHKQQEIVRKEVLHHNDSIILWRVLVEKDIITDVPFVEG